MDAGPVQGARQAVSAEYRVHPRMKLRGWQKTSHPELIQTPAFYLQKAQYIRNSPVHGAGDRTGALCMEQRTPTGTPADQSCVKYGDGPEALTYCSLGTHGPSRGAAERERGNGRNSSSIEP